MIESGAKISGDQRLTATAVVIGTGAGGGMMLRELARAGLDVLGLEEGSDLLALDMTQREDEMLPELFQERAGRATDDLAITVLQGRGLGGSTLHNTNLCKRTPAEILSIWGSLYGVTGLGESELRPTFETVERDLSVSRIPEDAVNANNDALRRGLAALGWKGGALSHNRVGCIGSGFCELGCAYDAKQNARKVLIPAAVEKGARIYVDMKATRIMVEQGRVRGVLARAAGGGEVSIEARIVVLAGSAVGSAALAIQSELRDPHDQMGQHLRMHPGGAVAGVFDGRIDGWKGIPQSWECTELLDFAPGSDKRVWITTAFAHPIGTAAILPGFGAAHMTRMRGYRNLAVLTAMLHDETEGRVTLDRDGRPSIRYKMIDADRAHLSRGLRAAGRILLAAGAREVVIPGIPTRSARSVAELDALDLSHVGPHGVPLTAVHPMGTMRLGDDPKRSVVKSTGEHHQVQGLFVADGSLFPTSIGGPPQLSIYALALHLSRHVVDAARRA